MDYRQKLQKLRTEGAVDLTETPTVSELKFRLFLDEKRNVILEFDQPVQFVGFTPKQAKEIGQNLFDLATRANRLNRRKRRISNKDNG